jgi:hypothetical protein
MADDSLFDLFDSVMSRYEDLNLTLPDAKSRQATLREQGRRCILVQTRYRDPSVTIETAAPIADADLSRRAAERPSVSYEPAVLLREHPMFFTFIAVSPELREQGVIPGGLTSSVDKVDGHVWTLDEFDWFTNLQD